MLSPACWPSEKQAAPCHVPRTARPGAVSHASGRRLQHGVCHAIPVDQAHAQAQQQTATLSWRLLWRALVAAPLVAPARPHLAVAVEQAVPPMAAAPAQPAPPQPPQQQPPPQPPPQLAQQPRRPKGGRSLLDVTLARLTAGEDSKHDIVEDMVSGLEAMRWARSGAHCGCCCLARPGLAWQGGGRRHSPSITPARPPQAADDGR